MRVAQEIQAVLRLGVPVNASAMRGKATDHKGGLPAR